ncbi:MAG: tRNA (guanosine(37)-N1)-methyltransferase TrmD [Candidatus Geothermincolia bacterium]
MEGDWSLEIDVFSIFPQMFESPLAESIPKRAQEKGLVRVGVHDIRAFAPGPHRSVDDTPFGGGPGMVMKPEPIFDAVTGTLGYGLHDLERLRGEVRVLLMDPAGTTFNQGLARELAAAERLAVICGRYEGVDERVTEHLATDVISIGDYIISGGELAAMVVIDAVIRLVPGVLSSIESVQEESFGAYALKYPRYTRPQEYLGWRVPEVLLGGDHREIEAWRRCEAERKAEAIRPDLKRRPCER